MDVIFDPLLPWPALYVAAAITAVFAILAIWRGLGGWWLRAPAMAVLLVALANPSLQDEERDPLSDIVVMVVDESASQRLSDRESQTAQAVDALTTDITSRGMELRTVNVPDGQGDAGTELMTALSDTLSEEPKSRIAGTILVTDGQLHDAQRAPVLEAPLHTLLTGRDTDWDRRLIVKNAPAFAILDEEITLTLRIEDQGAVPRDIPARASLSIAIDGEEAQTFQVPTGEDLQLPLTLPHGGINVLQFNVAADETELTDRNNSAVVQINGVRDRLRVLLVSGEPHAGERTWRNLLKSDAAVDLVHFTILRPPEKQDGVPVSELSLIAFPTRELFLEKVDEFDLIIFDRYKRRGILPALYFDSIRQYVEKGGAVLVAAGPDFASADSIYRSPLGGIMPAEPTARVLDQGFTPLISELGARHPVTEGLEKFAPNPTVDGIPGWGRWMRQIEVSPLQGQTVMTGIEERPLLTLDRVGEGRIALMASDHAWLWHRGFEGGGPQLELLRRLAHWMMKEPDLEEEALTAVAEGQTMTITRRTLALEVGEVEITAPDGTVTTVPLEETSPGRFTATVEGQEQGLYRLKEGDQESVIALGPAAPREFIETIASGAKLEGLVDATRGGIMSLEDGIPNLRMVGEGRNAAGRGWIGLTPRNAYVTTNVTVIPLVSPWLFLLLAMVLSVGAWLREGRR
ncbi:threonine dehydrogenase [Litoreibacter arenae]|uniref:Threonine dehydrogenase n=1 Tax=Litoreibacter arenae DSM 19593 TaxID=1123360 RepID=S9QPY6_9RHOB|nr:threonine dehydrogenase [Litoreibacter arenae]EPX81663.1 Threonine dehydrogenase [Litoreibacter arenae DSM 19593]